MAPWGGGSTRLTDTSSCQLSSDNPPSVFTAESSSGEKVESLLPARICVDCKLDLIVSVSVYRGVFGKQGYQCQGEMICFSFRPFLKAHFIHKQAKYDTAVVFPVCTCVVHKRCHQQVVTVCPRMKKTAKEQVRDVLNDAFTGGHSRISV